MTYAKHGVWWAAGAGSILITLAACSSIGAADSLGAASETPGNGKGSSSSGGNSGEASTAPSTDLGPTDNGVILVHAAGAPSFRLCFKNALDRLPAPDAELMPEANVIGVEVGSAVRIGPINAVSPDGGAGPGEVWLFSEPLIRSYYPPGQKGPTCRDLVDLVQIPYTVVGNISTDLSKGVHLLVLSGCGKTSPIHNYTTAECGDTYNGDVGNLAIKDLELRGRVRNSLSELPSQVVHLSQPLESFRAKKPLRISFGDISTANAIHTAAAVDPALGGPPKDFATAPAFNPSDTTTYAKLGFRVSIDNGGGSLTNVAEQSMADVQILSAPRDLPSSYYAAASNYVLLVLGDPEAKLVDGGPDPDDRRGLHLLAVPVIEPKVDAGVESDSGAGPSTPDGG